MDDDPPFMHDWATGFRPIATYVVPSGEALPLEEVMHRMGLAVGPRIDFLGGP